MRRRNLVYPILIIGSFLRSHFVPFIRKISAVELTVIFKHSTGSHLRTGLRKSIVEIVSINMRIADTLIIGKDSLLRGRNLNILRIGFLLSINRGNNLLSGI